MGVNCTKEVGTHSKNAGTLPLTVLIDFNIIVHPSIGLTLLPESVPAVTPESGIAQDTHTIHLNQKKRKIRLFHHSSLWRSKQIRAVPTLRCAGRLLCVRWATVLYSDTSGALQKRTTFDFHC